MTAPDAPATRCRCGKRYDAGDLIPVVVPARELRRMAALFADRLDHPTCRACPATLPLRNALIVAGDGWSAATAGDLPAAAIEQAARAAGVHDPLDVLADADELRAAIGRRFRRTLEVVGDITVGGDAVMAQRWHELTAELFVALALSATGGVPNVGIKLAVVNGRPDAVARAEFERQLAELQAIALSRAIDAAVGGEASLSVLLDAHVQPGAVFAGVAETIRELAEGLPADAPRTVRYAVLAMHAALCAATQQDDPLRRAWAAEFVAFAHAAADAPGDPAWTTALALRPDQARALVDERALWDVVASILSREMARSGELDSALSGAGFESLVGRVLGAFRLQAPAELHVETFAALFDNAVARGGTDGVEQLLAVLLDAVSERPDAFDRSMALYRQALDRTDGSPRARALLLWRLGAKLKELRRPDAFVELAGDAAQPWEQSLDDALKANLWTERSNALRLVGDNAAALAAMDAVAQLELRDDQRIVLTLNRAILRRDLGEPDLALKLLESIVEQAQDHKRIDILQSIATTLSVLGRFDDAAAAQQRARDLAVGPYARKGTDLELDEIATLARRGETERALALLRELPPAERLTLRQAMAEAAAWAALPDAARVAQRAGAVLRRLGEVAAEAARNRDHHGEREALWVRARVSEALADPGTVGAWERYLEAYDTPASARPVALVVLARHRWRAGRREDARALLHAVPAAMARAVGGAGDLGSVADAHGELGARLAELATDVLADDRFDGADARLLAELQRDGSGRARAIHLRGELDAFAGVGDAVLASLAPRQGTVHVVEWIELHDRIYTLRTRIEAGGAVTTDVPDAPRLSEGVGDVAKRLLRRLSTWTAERPGDPLAYPPWIELERWFAGLVANAEESDHVVVIEHGSFAGLPWHAIPGARWTTSYSPGWSALLARGERTRPQRLGLLSSPTVDDGVEVRTAFADSAVALQAIADATGGELARVEGVAADRAALERLLLTCDAVMLQCHGFVTDRDREVALMLAADGEAPLQDAIAAASDAMAAHRYSWREVQRLQRTPPLMLSAACSSGVSHVAGLGDRLGFFGALRTRGTTSLLAPGWDGFTQDVPAALVGTLARYLGGEGDLATSLRDTCRALCADGGLPRWRAWALRLEGDWR